MWKVYWLIFLLVVSKQFNFGQKPDLVVQQGHSSEINSIAYSLDNKNLASGSYDNTIKLWDIDSGKELRSFNGHNSGILSVTFSKDGKMLASGSAKEGKTGGVIKLWDVISGKELKTLLGHSDDVLSVAFSPDGKTLASCGRDKTVRLWDVKSGNKSATINTYTDSVNSVKFSNNGEILATIGSENEADLLKLFNVRNRKILKTFKTNSGNIWSVAFTNEGKVLASTSERTAYATEKESEKNIIKVWDVFNNKVLRKFEDYSSLYAVEFSSDGKILAKNGYDGKIILWEILTGKIFQEFDFTDGEFAGTIAFSPNSETLASLSEVKGEWINEDNRTIRLWNIKNGLLSKKLERKSSSIHTLKFDQNGKALIGQVLNRSKSAIENQFSLPNEVIGKFKAKHVLDLTTFFDVGNFPYLADVSLDNRTFASTGSANCSIDRMIDNEDFCNPNDIFLWDIKTGKLLRKLLGHTGFIDRVLFSADGKTLASGSFQDKTIRIWNIEDGTLLNTFGWIDAEGDVVTQAENNFLLSPNGIILVKENSDKTITFFDVKSGLEINSVVVPDIAQNGEFSPDGTILATEVNDEIILWDVKSGKKLQTLVGHSEWVFSIAFSRDGSKLVSGSEKGVIKIWDVKNGKELKSIIQNSSNSINSISFNPEGEKLITVSNDDIVRLLDIGTGNEIANFIIFGENDWLVTTPEGFFDGTPAAWRQLIWRFNNNTFDYSSIETYFNDFFYPNLLQDVLAGKSPQPKAGSELEKIDRRQPKVEIAAINGQTKSQLTANSVTDKLTTIVSIEVADNTEKKKQPDHQETGGAKDLRLFRNDSLVKVWHDDVFETKQSGCEKVVTKPNEPRRVRCLAEIQIIAGENNLTAYAFNSANVKSNDDTVSIKGDFPKKGGTLYVLAVGVNKYANSAYDLRFAVPDVLDIETALKEQQDKISIDTKLKQYAHTEFITLKDETATKDNILLALNRFSKDAANKSLPENLCANLAGEVCTELKTELAKIKPTQPEDALIIYYAGHGTSKEQRFYLLPHNFTGKGGEKSLDEEGVSDIELNETLEKVDAGRLLMVIDACQSGQALGGEKEGRGPMNSKGLAQLAYDKGMLILTAAQSQQAALEAVTINGKEINHGLLTYTLLEAFKDAQADKDGNKQLWEREWLDYAVEKVPQLQLEAMKQRHVEIEKGSRDAEIIYKSDDKNADPAKRSVQTPRVFYKREANSNPLIVAQP